MFEIVVEDIFSITGRGTVFAGKITSGIVSIGDPVICKTPSTEIRTRVIGLEELGTRKLLQTAYAGSSVGVLCKHIDQQKFADVFDREGETARVFGVTLILGKKSWWQF